MGIIDFIKGGVKELAVARPDAAKDFWKQKKQQEQSKERPEPKRK